MSDIIVAADQLKSIVQRVERLEGEISDLNADKSEIYKEARANGFDVKAIKKVISKRKLDESKRDEEDAVFDTYWDAVHGSGLVHAPARENIEQFDPITGEFVDDAGTPSVGSLQAAPKPLATRGPEESVAANSLETANELQHPVSSPIGNPEHALAASTRPDGEDSMARSARTEANAVTVVGTESGTVTNSEIAPAAQGEAEAPATDERKAPGFDDRSGEGANTGGDDVTAEANQGRGLVNISPAHAIHYEIVPPVPMKAAPFAHCFPELSKDAYQALVADIEANGVIEPIVRLGDMIVDGWSRYNAARHLGIKYPVVFYTGDDALVDAIGWQRSSRDWTPTQEAKVAAALAKHLPARADDIWAAFHIALADDGELVSA